MLGSMTWFRRWKQGEGHAARAILDGLPDAALLMDGATILAANAPLRVALGPAQPVRPGMSVERIFAPACREDVSLWLRGGPLPRACRLAAPEGMVEQPVSPHRIALSDDGGLILLRPTSPSEGMAEADRLQTLGTLAGGIAHDFNNLLTVVLGASEDALTLAGPRPNPALVADITQIRQAAERGAQLVRQLLAYARRQVLAPQLVELNQAVEGIARLLDRAVAREGVTLELVLDESGRLVRIDPSQLDQVVMNLAMNARQAMPQGGRLRLATGRQVLLSAMPGVPDTVPAGRWTVLEVADTGTGIPPEMLPRIFEPFFTTRLGEGGNGLGLATVHGIVRQSGGYMVVESRPGEGTRFRILLPRVEENEHVTEASVAAPGPRLAPPPSGTILLVEDEAPLRRLAERALLRAGHDVAVAEDAESALEMVEAGLVPSMLVSDVSMPGMDGVALANILRSRLPGLPVLLVSGYAPAAVEAELGAGRLRYLPKPYKPAELVAVIADQFQFS